MVEKFYSRTLLEFLDRSLVRQFLMNPLTGDEHTFDIGAGRGIKLFKTPFELNLALEYVTTSGEGKDSKLGSLDGHYDTKALSLFTALAYRM